MEDMYVHQAVSLIPIAVSRNVLETLLSLKVSVSSVVTVSTSSNQSVVLMDRHTEIPALLFVKELEFLIRTMLALAIVPMKKELCVVTIKEHI